MQEDFAGKNGFVWFTGVIMARDDSAKVGRLRVRILGWHDSDAKIEDLPLAEVLLPVNASRTFSLPAEGEWVHGFFKDGEKGQYPVIMGVYPGIIPTSEVTYVDKGYQDCRAPKDKLNDPKTPVGVVTTEAGKPNIPFLSQESISQTGIDIMNAIRSHKCPDSDYVRRSMGYAKGLTLQIATAIRAGIQALLKALGIAPAAGGMASMIRSLAQQIKKITKFIKDINDAIGVFVTYVAKIKAVIQFLLNLPKDLLALLKDCLKKAYAELAAGFMAIAKDFNLDGIIDNSSEIAKAAKDALKDVKALAVDTGKLMASPGKVFDAVANPSKLTETQAATLVQDFFPGAKKYNPKDSERP